MKYLTVIIITGRRQQVLEGCDEHLVERAEAGRALPRRLLPARRVDARPGNSITGYH